MKKGISLAVLVVTIIVLVILTAATMAAINGQNGVIDEARNAVSDSKKVEAEATIQMEIAALQIKAAKINTSVKQYITDNSSEIDSNLTSKGISVSLENEDNLIFSLNNTYSITTDINGNILSTSTGENIPSDNPPIYNGKYGNKYYINGIEHALRTFSLSYGASQTFIDEYEYPEGLTWSEFAEISTDFDEITIADTQFIVTSDSDIHGGSIISQIPELFLDSDPENIANNNLSQTVRPNDIINLNDYYIYGYAD